MGRGAGTQLVLLCSPYYPENDRNKRNYQKNVDDAPGVITKESDGPANNQDYGDDVQNASHIDYCLSVLVYVQFRGHDIYRRLGNRRPVTINM